MNQPVFSFGETDVSVSLDHTRIIIIQLNLNISPENYLHTESRLGSIRRTFILFDYQPCCFVMEEILAFCLSR